MVFSTSKFQSLSVRPPTPPKDLQNVDIDKDADQVLAFLDDPFGKKEPVAKVAAAKTLLSTPQSSPPSEGGIPSSSAGSSSKKKRVNFLAQPCGVNAGTISSQLYLPLHSSPLRPLPQTRVSKPLKSILKPSDATPTPPPANEGAPAHTYKSFADMLESIVKQLASTTRAARLDAYHSLLRTMQAYEKLPDIQALINKMGLLTQFIQRDMQAVGINGAGLDSQLITQALKFLMALVRIPEVKTVMSNDFCGAVVDRIISVASDPSPQPKVIVNTHLAVLMQQNFPARVITPVRVERILDALDTIEERVTGLSVQAYRVRIFRKLIQQRPEIMNKHTERWFKHTAVNLLSHSKDINQSALDTAISAAKAFGNDRQVAKSVYTVMNRPKADKSTATHGMVKELQKMLRSDHAIMAPQIWSAVTALLSVCLTNELAGLAEWLKLIELFFQSENKEVIKYANMCPGFLAYAKQLDKDTPVMWTKILKEIPSAQFQRRRSPWKKSERDAAASGYFALLYHALAPTATPAQLDRYWKEFVVDFWTHLVRKHSKDHAFAACRVVSALLDGTRKKWDPLRTLELRSQALMSREELPILDSKWVRKSLPSILEFIEMLLETMPWAADEGKDEPAKELWVSLLNSLNSASSQEVMATTDAKDAVAHLTNFLRRVWERDADQLALSQQKEDSGADKLCFLLEKVVEKLGPAQFADKCLTKNQNEFEVTATPSHRSRNPGSRTSSLLYFVDLLVNQSEGKLSEALRLRALKLLVKPCYSTQKTRLSGLELLRDCCLLVDASTRTSLSDCFWSEIAGLVTTCLDDQSSRSNESGSRQLGKEYDIVVDVLASGFPYLSKEPQGQKLLDSLAHAVQREAGDGAVVLAVIEKVSENVLKPHGGDKETDCLPLLSILLNHLPKSISSRAVEQGRQELWPSTSKTGKTADLNPYTHLYDVIVSNGASAYENLNLEHAPNTNHFLVALATSVKQCPTSLLAVYLRKIQETISLWVKDPERKLQRKTAWVKDVYSKVVSLWTEVCNAMYKLPRDKQILIHLESLITSGLTSQRRGIVDLSIASWNATFGKEETIRYPTQLEEALRRLSGSVELSLPSLDVQGGEMDVAASFYESDSNADLPEPEKRLLRVKETPFKIVKSSRKTRSNSRSPAMPSSTTKRASGRTPKGRLRHENSQIEFEPVVSSPANPFNQESQILTERQREVKERQTRSSLFAEMRPRSPAPETIAPSPLEFHSDAMSIDDLPSGTSRTNFGTLLVSEALDSPVRSSPTPSARKRRQEVASDRSSMATPTAMRTTQALSNVDELGSSPPQFNKHTSSELGRPARASMSFDEGTTIEEEEHFLTGTQEPETEVDTPSSTLDLQLTAQFDAEIQAQKQSAVSAVSTQPKKGTLQGHRKKSTGKQVHEDDVDIDMGTVTDIVANTGASSTSRVEDSFSSQAVDAEGSQQRSLRRSQRQSLGHDSQTPSSKKRKASAGRGLGKPKKNKTQDTREEETGDDFVAATPLPETSTTPKSAPTSVAVPDTSRSTRSARRSASMLNQNETQSDGGIVEDTPAPKRARRSTDKDVSEAKSSTPTSSQHLRSKRLSHVQVTPRHSDPTVSSKSVETGEEGLPEEATGEGAPKAAAEVSEVREDESQAASNSVATPSRSFAERVILTPQRFLNQLRYLKDALFGTPQLAFNSQEEREADDLLFDVRRMLLHSGGQQGQGGR